jgi:hypothetical protein
VNVLTRLCTSIFVFLSIGFLFLLFDPSIGSALLFDPSIDSSNARLRASREDNFLLAGAACRNPWKFPKYRKQKTAEYFFLSSARNLLKIRVPSQN